MTKRMKWAACIALVLVFALPFHASAATLSSAVQGTATNGTQFVGTLTVTGFQIVNNVLVATGNLVGNILRNGNVVGAVNQAVQIPLASTSGTCTVLTLTLGPLDLNLLGLQVHLNQVVLTITANPAGGILGQLLCDLANALGPGGTLQAILADLNAILANL